MTIEEIRQESERDGIGPLLWRILVGVCRRVASTTSYEVVEVFNHGLQWDADSFAELAQEVVSERLWPKDQEQLYYVLTVAQSEDELRRLLSVQVKRTLSRRRGKVASDRLLDRVRNLAETGSCTVWKTPDAEWVAIEQVPEPVPLAHADIRAAIRIVAKIPRLPTPADASRASMVYAPRPFQVLVENLVDRFGALDFRALREIFEEFLTPRNRTGLREDEEIPDSRDLPESTTLRNQMRAQIDQQVIDAAKAIDPIRRGILIGKFVSVDERGDPAPITDGDLGQGLGRSRQTIIKQKALAVEDVRRLIESVPAEFREDATGLLLETLVELEVSP